MPQSSTPALRAARVYAEELAAKGRGTPLWNPVPTAAGEVHIGDVGFLFRGEFHRLFNITVGEDDPLNINGVPEDFEPLPAWRRMKDRRNSCLT